MNTELLKAKLYLVELRLQQDQARHPVGTKDPVSGEGIGGQYKLVNKTGSAASKILADTSTTVRTDIEAKKEIQDFVESIYSKEDLDKVSKLDPTPEIRKAIGDVFNDVGRKIDTGIRKSVTDAIDNVKKFNVKDLIDRSVKDLKKFGEDHILDIAIAVGVALTVTFAALGVTSLVTGAATLIVGGKVAHGLLKCVGGLIKIRLTRIIASNTGELIMAKVSADQGKKNQEKVKNAVSEPSEKQPDQEKEEDKLILDNFNTNTEPSQSFEEKYKEKNGIDYDKKSDPDVAKLDNRIVTLTKLYTEKLIFYQDKLSGDFASRYQEHLDTIQQDIESAVEERQKYYDLQ